MEDVELTRCAAARIHVRPMQLGSFFRDFVSHDSFEKMQRTLMGTGTAPHETCALTWHKVSASQMRYIKQQLLRANPQHPSCELARADKAEYGSMWASLTTCRAMKTV